MAVNLCHRILSEFLITKLNFVRYAHKIRGKPPGVARTLQQRLEEINAKDELYTASVNIGLPFLRTPRSVQLRERLGHLQTQRNDKNLERLARNRELEINLEDVESEWLKNNGPHQIKAIADHYAVFQHLYGEGFFIPRVPLNISYNLSDTETFPVYYGNVIKPFEAKNAPNVTFQSKEDSIWTLMMTNLDGHFTEPGKEYIHWCVTNIPGNDVTKGDTLVQYIQPFPPKGTGFHRHVFVLYKQNEKINYSIKRVLSSDPLGDRTFVTRDWYQQHQDSLTPAGLAFFQSNWDPTLTEYFHHTLNMKEPLYEYDFPKPYIRPQTWYPLKQPFNLYMDKYRDPKQVAKEYLLLKLKKEHPFKKPDPPLKYPNAHAFPKGMPSWLKLHEKKIRLGWGRINDV